MLASLIGRVTVSAAGSLLGMALLVLATPLPAAEIALGVVNDTTPQEHKLNVTRAPGDPPNTVRVNGQLAHAHRFLAKLSPDGARAAPARVRNPQSISRRFNHVPSVVTLDLPEAGVDPSAAAPAVGHETRYQAQLDEWRQNGTFAFVEPDYLVYPTATPNDSAFTDGTLWGLQNAGQNGGVAGADINAAPAWDVTTGSRQVIVAVIDSGARTTHQDLAPNLWTNPNEIPGNGIDDDGNGYIDDLHGIDAITGSGDPSDNTGHGTHVIGIIGAAANAGGPHVGVAWEVQLMPLKFLSAQSGFTSDAVECINYAIAHGAQIINASWGGSSFSTTLRNAIEAANQAGILFVAAAGNQGHNTDTNPHYPSNFTLPNVISVAALDRSDQLPSFSNFGASTVDLGAPGFAIFSTSNGSDTAYASSHGTSMATPHVAGVAALVRSQFPSIDAATLKERILSTTTPVPALAGKTLTGGRLEAHGALTTGGDGDLELSIAVTQLPFLGGRTVSIFVKVTDLSPVLGATVTAELVTPGADPIPAPTPRSLLDDGVAPDPSANDAQYSGTLLVPEGTTEVSLRVIVQAAGKNPRGLSFNVPVIPPPVNDDFANRTLLPSGTTQVTGTTVAASRERGEPVNPPLATNRGDATVWYTWTAPRTEVVSINTAGSSIDTTLAIYRGTALSQLELIASNDDTETATTSAVRFVAIAGSRYQIQVDGVGGQQGGIVVNVPEVAPPTGHARLVTQPGPVQAAEGSTVSLDVEATGTDPVSFQWFRNESSLAAATTRTLSLADLTPNESGPYRVRVTNGQGSEFSDPAILTVDPAGTPIGNDPWSGAIALSGGSGSAIGYNIGATAETGEPNHAGSADPNPSVWWQWNARVAGALRVRTFGSDFDTVLAAYTGSSVETLTLLAENDNAGNDSAFRQSEISFPTQAGQTYFLAVSGAAGGTGTIRLDYRETTFAHQVIANGSFETGDLTTWSLSDVTNPDIPAQVGLATALIQSLLPDSTIAPSEGHHAFIHGFGGSNAGLIQLSQSFTLPLPDLSLMFDYRAGWSFSSASPPTLPRTFSVSVDPAGGGASLASQTVLSSGLSTVGDTTRLTSVIPLQNQAGQSVTLRFSWNVPEASKGPGFFELDHIRLVQGCQSLDGTTFTVASSPTDLTQGDHFHSLPGLDRPSVAEVGRLHDEEVRGLSEFDLRETHLATRATLTFQVARAGGLFGGQNDTPFEGTITLEAYTPLSVQTPMVAAYQRPTLMTLSSLATSSLTVSGLQEIDVTAAMNQQIRSNLDSLGIRFRAHPLPNANGGAWTFEGFSLVLDQRVGFADPALEQAVRAALVIPNGMLKTHHLSLLTRLEATDAGITSLRGLEYAIHLKSLDVRGNELTDLSPIGQLTQLRDEGAAGLQLENNLLEIAPGSPQRQVIATLSQLPGLTIAFRPQRLIDNDTDGLDDRFEERIISASGGSMAALAEVNPLGDFDADLQTNYQEFRRYSDPTDATDFGKAGDIDGDGTVSLLDLVRIHDHLRGAGLTLDPDRSPFADTDLDGTIDASDRAALINQILEGPALP